MNTNEQVKLSGAFTVTLTDKDGVVKDVREVKNVVVTAGKNHLAAVLAESPAATTFMPYIAVGTGATGATASDTTLQTESFRKLGTKSSSTNVWQNTVILNAGEATGTITEAGIFSASSSGTMLARQTFTGVVKSASDLLTVTWQITFA
jgi:hypothetical protein